MEHEDLINIVYPQVFIAVLFIIGKPVVAIPDGYLIP
jgi:hypothetical protein